MKQRSNKPSWGSTTRASTAKLRRQIEQNDRQFDRAAAGFQRKLNRVAFQAGWNLGQKLMAGHRKIGRQKSVIRVRYTKPKGLGAWKAHGKYLQREGAAIEGTAAYGPEGVVADVAALLDGWQKGGDPYLWRLILSPERGAYLDLEAHCRDLVQDIESESGHKLEWVAIDHHNTDNPHTHLVLRGIDARNQEVRFAKAFVKDRIRNISSDIATRQLGYRTQADAEGALESLVKKSGPTTLDRTLAESAVIKEQGNERKARLNVNKLTVAKPRRAALIGRLNYLESRGNATKRGAGNWEIPLDLLMRLRREAELENLLKLAEDHKSDLAHNPKIAHRITLGKPNEPKQLIGRVIGFGVWGDEHIKPYMLLETQDDNLVVIETNSRIDRMRALGEVKEGSILECKPASFTPRSTPDKPAQGPVSYYEFSPRPELTKPQDPARVLEMEALKWLATHTQRPTGNSCTPTSFQVQYNKYVNAGIDRLIAHGRLAMADNGEITPITPKVSPWKAQWQSAPTWKAESRYDPAWIIREYSQETRQYLIERAYASEGRNKYAILAYGEPLTLDGKYRFGSRENLELQKLSVKPIFEGPHTPDRNPPEVRRSRKI